MPKKPDDLMVMTREGVRKENPLMTVGRGYYPTRWVRTADIRKEADTVLKDANMTKTGTVTVKAKAPQYKRGGMIKRTGLARLHRGERVLTKSQQKRMVR